MISVCHHVLIKMFLAGVVVIISLPFLRSSAIETHGKTINRHFFEAPEWHEKQEPTQCSLSWGRKLIPSPSDSDTILASCEDATHEESLCDRESCHMGQSDQSPEEKPLIKYLFFTGCMSLKDEFSGHKTEKRYTVYPRTYEVSYDLRKLVVKGYAAEIEGQSEESYTCTWTDQLEQNFQRVWCNNCTDTVWK
ncbi:hypothetical protein PTTG_11686 [Puccinia triticina 1-1 BBBD Race 1]|uniref:Uncharacterized protein n=2 Tax=Puccinia triticina TaxID=208348 RepID=A0A180GZJ0_PUCT1|nr:uncharacterized protein PtA15_8A366 [Puccinia triticina]OAV98235.1 hypothetical protein PTTG_11686 [Puccinia triticina 1-1 BBBD Race 1]WAQ87462.1 hypothetical protein PtA15_8A366 [Puccinia triticina]WAR57320.1 hypothetical protein PtB15_8B367 [Puccinia triticina]